LRAFAADYERSRRSCLDAIRDGDSRAASHLARICHTLRPDSDSRRLLALAASLRGDWHAVAVLASRDG
jgi:hypothetical protein